MHKKKNRRFKLLIKFIFKSLIVFLILFLIIRKIVLKKSIINIIDDNKYSEYVTDESESDSDVIDTMFADGMPYEDFLSVLNKKSEYLKRTGEYNFIKYDFDKKLHYSELEEIYKNMNNSKIVNVEVIGKSVDNRNIYGIEVGKGKNVLLIDANIHAAESGNVLILTKFLSDIINSYENGDKDIKDILNNIKIAAIPSINPDGYEIYNFGIDELNNKNLWIYQNREYLSFDNIKCNANGVDLHRNFPTQNSGLFYKSKGLKSNVSVTKTTKRGVYFNGYSVGSEPEVQAVMYFMLKHYKNTYTYVNMHSQGRVIYAGKPNLSDEFNEKCVELGKTTSSITNYKLHKISDEAVGEGNDGSATDFMSELANGFRFSKKTLRLSSDKYIDNTCNLTYNYPVITIETTTVWSRDPSYFKTEYESVIKRFLYTLIKKM